MSSSDDHFLKPNFRQFYEKEKPSRSTGLKFVFISNTNEPHFFVILTVNLTKVETPVFLHLQILFQKRNRPTHWPVV